jgi:hypothetical protein
LIKIAKTIYNNLEYDVKIMNKKNFVFSWTLGINIQTMPLEAQNFNPHGVQSTKGTIIIKLCCYGKHYAIPLH